MARQAGGPRDAADELHGPRTGSGDRGSAAAGGIREGIGGHQPRVAVGEGGDRRILATTGNRSRCHVHRDAGRSVGVVGRVDAGAADQDVGAGSALEDVVALPAVEGVGAGPAGKGIVAVVALNEVGVGVAGEMVGIAATKQVLDAGVVVARRLETGGAVARAGLAEVDLDAPADGIVRRVDAGPAVDEVGSPAAVDHVIAVAADDGVVAVLAAEIVAEPGADQKIDTGQPVGAGAGRVLPGILDPEVDANTLGSAGVADRVGFRAAADDVVANTAV